MQPVISMNLLGSKKILFLMIIIVIKISYVKVIYFIFGMSQQLSCIVIMMHTTGCLLLNVNF